MGRKDACRRLSLDEEKERMDQQGIIHGLRSQNELGMKHRELIKILRK